MMDFEKFFTALGVGMAGLITLGFIIGLILTVKDHCESKRIKEIRRIVHFEVSKQLKDRVKHDD